MKIKPEHYAALKTAIESVGTDNIKQHATIVSDKRLRWDCLYASKLKIGDGAGMSGLPLYSYMDDTHIDTALRHIMKELF